MSNTKFKITLTGTDKSQWDVSLGKSILDGLSQATKDEYAEAHGIVVLQNDTKLALRFAGDGAELELALKATYPNVVVTPHVKAEPKAKMTEEQLLAKFLGIPVARVTPEMIAIARSAKQ